MKFTYSSGQRPLDGYTIKRGVGRGGFGEVYYAVSDGGKEVALKLVSGNLDVELRGMAQCLNFKHPNLVELYDLRTDTQGEHWVVMEYIAGETLSVVLNRHPNGINPDLAREWFLSLCRAVAYLHDHGIVHRDLKPGNVFLENGMIKVGDYGLCKFISGSHRSAQTQSVGTVHYMAPEISTGNYGKQIDIYALGIMLYEMLTGKVPFDGESAGEILMKHLTSPPDLSGLSPAYRPIVDRALCKNPAHRYSSVPDMIKDVEALGRPVEVLEVGAQFQRAEHIGVRRVREQPPTIPPVPVPLPTLRGRVGELAGSLALSVALALMFTVLWGLLVPNSRQWPPAALGVMFFLTVAVTWGVLVPAKLWEGRSGDTWTRRLALLLLGVAVGGAALWLNGWLPHWPGHSSSVRASSPGPPWPTLLSPEGGSLVAGYLSYFALALFALRWWKMADRRRSHRFSLFPVAAAGFWALVLLVIWPWPEPAVGAGAVILSAVIIQLVSPWQQPLQPVAKRVRLRHA
jgi:eukaryotic-like serine/threonine-protein kinase